MRTPRPAQSRPTRAPTWTPEFPSALQTQAESSSPPSRHRPSRPTGTAAAPVAASDGHRPGEVPISQAAAAVSHGRPSVCRGSDSEERCPRPCWHRRSDLVAAVFGGVVLHRNGWRIVYLGADTPLTDLGRAVKEKRPDVVILAAVTAQRFQECLPELVTLTPAAPLRLAGVGATILDGDPITEAQRLTPTRWMKALGGPGRVERIR
jgi:hypothetical protein